MRCLIDANVVLDVLAKREPHYRNASLIWKLCETGEIQGSISALTAANLIYIMRKELDAEKTADVMEKLRLIFTIEDFCANDVIRAAKMKWKDFEDAVQSVTAFRIHADCIITRNAGDFAGSQVQPLSPFEFLSENHWN